MNISPGNYKNMYNGRSVVHAFFAFRSLHDDNIVLSYLAKHLCSETWTQNHCLWIKDINGCTFENRLLKSTVVSEVCVVSFLTRITRMHSNGMRTVRLLTVCQHEVGVSAQGVSTQGGLSKGDVYPGGVCWGGLPGCVYHTPCGQTDTCENITFANFVCGR